MHHPGCLVKILDCLGNLNDDMSTKLLAEIGQSNNLVEQFASRTQLQHDVIILGRFGEVHELDDVGVIDLSHNLHFFEDVGSLRTS